MTTSTLFTLIYLCTTLIFSGVAFKCLGGNKENFLVTIFLSIIASSAVTTLGLSIWLAIDDSAWEIKTQKHISEIDSIKIEKNRLVYIIKEDNGDDDDVVLKNIVKTEKKDSYVEYYREIKTIDAPLGEIYLKTRKKTEKILYLNEKDYETYKTSKNNSKK